MKIRNLRKLALGSSLAMATVLSASISLADTYSVTITNLTKGQSFTPRAVFSHTAGKTFVLGEAAITELETIAESGDVAPLMEALSAVSDIVTDMTTGAGLLAPGASQTVSIEGVPGSYLSVLSMLIPTNDGFIGFNGVVLPMEGSASYTGVVYDAGTETNDEDCANIPGPVCGGTGLSPDDAGEGFVHVHSGIHGGGDVSVADRDWRNPAAMLTITKVDE